MAATAGVLDDIPVDADDPSEDPAEVAELAGLIHVSDDVPGFRRVRRGRGFSYVDEGGAPITSERTRRRIRALAIPPAWTDVWICPLDRGHLQATGRDARGRKQYRYHAKWRVIRDAHKYDRLAPFGAALPTIRARLDEDGAGNGLQRLRVLAMVVQLLDATLIRVGNPEYARDNDSYGLTTLRDDHVEVRGGTLRLHFRGKSGKVHSLPVDDPRLARSVKRMAELPGQELFRFDEDDQLHAVTSDDVNDYLQEITGRGFTSKDFRTWGGTVVAATNLYEIGPATTTSQVQTNFLVAVDAAAQRLGNTRAVCRQCYVHPAVLASYADGSLHEHFRSARSRRGLAREESAVLRLLEATSTD